MIISTISYMSVRMLSMYFSILLGFCAARNLSISRDSIANLIFYIVMPLMVFFGVLSLEVTPERMIFPLVVTAISSFLCLCYLKISKYYVKDGTANIMAFSAGAGNTGYFGIPVATILFSEAEISVYILAIFGVIIYESTLGYYVCSRGNFTVRQSLIKVSKLPSLYAFIAGISIALMGFELPEFVTSYGDSVRGAYTILGMMIIGMGLADSKSYKIDSGFLTLAFSARFVAWPLICGALVYLDSNYTMFFDLACHKSLLLLSIVPMAANTVILASIFNSKPEKWATAVLISTIVALVFIPVMVCTVFSSILMGN